MFIHLDFGVAFQLFCVAQGLSTGVYLLVARPRRAGATWLALLVLALALDAGFNSKTTFNRVFKEKHGLTPREYQKKYRTTFRDDATAVPG